MLSVRPSKKLRKHLAEHGVSAQATVVEISKRGSANLDQPSTSRGTADADPMTSWVRRKTKVRIAPERGDPFEVEAKLTYRLIAEPQPGAVITVVYDPDDHSKIIVDEEAEMRAVQGGGADAANAAIAAAGYDPTAIWQTVQAAQSAQPGTGGMDPDVLKQALDSASRLQTVGDDSVANLERLAELRRQGAITEEEFEAAKKRLID